MTNLLSRWRKTTGYESLLWLESACMPGVRFSIRKMSLSQRIDLSAKLRDLTLKNDFLRAGELADQLDAVTAELMVKRLYLEWAVSNLEGIKIDGKPGSVALLIECGPDVLTDEIASAISAQLELSEAERKNS